MATPASFPRGLRDTSSRRIRQDRTCRERYGFGIEFGFRFGVGFRVRVRGEVQLGLEVRGVGVGRGGEKIPKRNRLRQKFFKCREGRYFEIVIETRQQNKGLGRGGRCKEHQSGPI